MKVSRSANLPTLNTGLSRSTNWSMLIRFGLVLFFLNISLQTTNANPRQSYGGGSFSPSYGRQGPAPFYGGQGHASSYGRQGPAQSYGGQGHITSYGGEMAVPSQMWPEVMARLSDGGLGGFANLGAMSGFGGQGGMAGFGSQGPMSRFGNQRGMAGLGNQRGMTGFYDQGPNNGFNNDLYTQRNSYDVGRGFGGMY